jgi:DMSO/TMAO reductase YedYZ molybdopterin-dependent catalytic subunit
VTALPPSAWRRGNDAPARVLPPGQRLGAHLKVQHYGRVPRLRPDAWRLTVSGATADGSQLSLTMAQFAGLPRVRVVGDLHCVTRWSVLDNVWEGVAARTLLAMAPPADTVTHVTAYAEYGYSATLRLEDLASPRSVLATHRDGQPLPPEHGWPVRLVVPHLYGWKGPKWLRGLEYAHAPQRGFWEQRGYHLVGDCWREERYAHQE